MFSESSAFLAFFSSSKYLIRGEAPQKIAELAALPPLPCIILSVRTILINPRSVIL